ncbi:MAG: hypothetical protein C4523_00335 [Myxococcales bacterium]|nr:MAG: hypothetical protein C4523_00335 [Myxococcales bacterium]
MATKGTQRRVIIKKDAGDSRVALRRVRSSVIVLVAASLAALTVYYGGGGLRAWLIESARWTLQQALGS